MQLHLMHRILKGWVELPLKFKIIYTDEAVLKGQPFSIFKKTGCFIHISGVKLLVLLLASNHLAYLSLLYGK